MNGRALRIGSTIAFGLLLVACDGGSGSGPTAPKGLGRLSLRLTDAPIDELSAVHVYVSGLTLKPSGSPVQRVASSVGTFELLSLQGTTKQLVDLEVPAGTYDFVQIDLDQSQSDVVEIADPGNPKPVQIASQEIKVLGGFTVPDGGELTVVFDFDLAKSIQHLGNGHWLITPVILQVAPPPA